MKKLRRVDLPAPIFPSTVMVKGRPEERPRRTSEEGNGMLKVLVAQEVKLQIQIMSRITASVIFVLGLFLYSAGSIEHN